MSVIDIGLLWVCATESRLKTVTHLKSLLKASLLRWTTLVEH
jgi:hypothetical protein